MRTVLFLLDFLIGGVLRRVRALVPLADSVFRITGWGGELPMVNISMRLSTP